MLTTLAHQHTWHQAPTNLQSACDGVLVEASPLQEAWQHVAADASVNACALEHPVAHHGTRGLGDALQEVHIGQHTLRFLWFYFCVIFWLWGCWEQKGRSVTQHSKGEHEMRQVLTHHILVIKSVTSVVCEIVLRVQWNGWTEGNDHNNPHPLLLCDAEQPPRDTAPTPTSPTT